ncbi:MAG: hypothetical protein GC200_07620 [Tepidisphaera sp.]|nr:hypothetical protein [Tepidisphaera sp.]
MSIRCVMYVSLAVAAAAGQALAIDVRSTFDSVNPGIDCQITYNSGTTENTRAGQMNWTRVGGTYAGLQGSYSAFCIEVTQNIGYGGTYDYDVNTLNSAPRPADGSNSPMGQAKADRIAELYGRHYASLSTNSDFAAFQSAIWNIVYDTDNTIDTGSFSVNSFNSSDSTTRTKANTWLAGLNGDANYFRQGLFALTSDTVQDMIVPSPGSAALLGLGGLVLSRRRR